MLRQAMSSPAIGARVEGQITMDIEDEKNSFEQFGISIPVFKEVT
jgi:hypothetical protein